MNNLVIAVLLSFLLVTAARWVLGKSHTARKFVRTLPERIFYRRRYPFIAEGLTALAARLILLFVAGVPQPGITDEISYLFMAETFLHGRVANPPHPLWTHFEPVFILSQPTYASVYPVAQGLILAAGKILLGSYWSGVAVSSALMFGAICWMLQAWMPVRWAVFGSLLAVVQFGLTGYWVNSYWGGCHAALAGALVLGACRRMEQRRRIGDSVILGLGLAILANSRPYEGFFLGITAMGIFLVRTRRLRPLLPTAVVLAIALSAMQFYFSRVTGDRFRMPSQVYADQYAIVPLFFWQKLRPEPTFQSKEIGDAMRSCIADYQRYSSASGIVRTTLWKIFSAGNFLLGPLVLVPVLMLPWLARSARMRDLLLCCAVVLGAIALVVPFQIHYAAPVAGAIIALNTECLRRLWVARRYGNPVGNYLVPAAPVLVAMLTAFSLAATAPAPLLAERFAMEHQLQTSGGKHLVFVRYGADHPLSKEWVFNGPEIDSQQVVWARDQGIRNDQLIHYFPQRRVWMVEPDEHPVKVARIR